MPSCCEIEEVHPLSAMKSVECYEILEKLQLAEKGATLYKARYIKQEPKAFSGKLVAIKVFNRQRMFDNVFRMARDIEHSKLSDHKNVTKVHCSFVHDGNLWVVMPYDHVKSLSLARLVAARRRSSGGGLAEREIGFLLREVLEGLNYLHERGWMHKGFDVSHIFVDTVGAVRIDFDSLSYDPDGMFEAEAAVWPAHPPEIRGEEGLEMKSDIWGFGIVALRLALGYVPATSYEELAVFLAGWPEMVEKESKEEEAMVVKKERITLTSLFRRFGCFSGGSSVKEEDAKVMIISPAFVKMVADCLTPEPAKRPSTKQLMECEFIRELQSQKTPVMASLLK